MLRRARAGRDLSPGALPADPDAFVDWYRAAAFTHPLYEHDLYAHLASEADRGAIEWFLRMEAAGRQRSTTSSPSPRWGRGAR
jgi:hypothetical protein